MSQDLVKRNSGGIAGHPAGLTTLFLIEVWERASFYGMRAILTLYMVAAVTAGGLGFSEEDATALYGTYTACVYLTPLLGGFIADRYLGARRTLLVGGVIIAFGHLAMVFESLPFFYAGLALIVLGTGLLKPNVTTMVGQLYPADDPRRTAGFNILYMGINIGGALAPLVCGFLAQSAAFKRFLGNVGFDPLHSWHWGFGAAGVGMVFGLVQYALHRTRLAHLGNKPERKAIASAKGGPLLSNQEWKRMAAIGVLFVACVMFWAVFEQAGSSLTLFAEKLTDNSIGTWQFPSTWYAALNSLYVIALTPVFALIWTRLSARGQEPSSPAKFAIGLTFLSAGTALMVPACMLAMQGKVSPVWLLGVYFLQTIGELCLSPVGLETVNKLAPARFASLIMGIWFLAVAVGNKLAGVLAGFSSTENPGSMAWLYGAMACSSLVLAAILWRLTPRVKSLMSANG